MSNLNPNHPENLDTLEPASPAVDPVCHRCRRRGVV